MTVDDSTSPNTTSTSGCTALRAPKGGGAVPRRYSCRQHHSGTNEAEVGRRRAREAIAVPPGWASPFMVKRTCRTPTRRPSRSRGPLRPASLAHDRVSAPSLRTCKSEIWCQRRDSNSQTPVSKTGCYSNSHTLALWCTGEDLNLRVPLGETGLQPVRFGRAHAPVQTWRKVDESNAHRSSRCPGFQDQLPAIQQYLPHGGEYGS